MGGLEGLAVACCSCSDTTGISILDKSPPVMPALIPESELRREFCKVCKTFSLLPEDR
jgi:hypothetical protein